MLKASRTQSANHPDILTVHHHGIEKFHYDGFEINSERDFKSVFQIDYQFTDEKSREIFESLQ